MSKRSYSRHILGILVLASSFLLFQNYKVIAEEVTKDISDEQMINQEVINHDRIQFKEGDAVLVIGNESENFSLIMLCKQAKVPVLFINEHSTWDNVTSIVKEKNINRIFTVFRSDRIFDFDYLVAYEEVKAKLNQLGVQHKEISGEGSEETSYKIFNSFNQIDSILITDSDTAIKESESLSRLYKSELNMPILIVQKNQVTKVAKEYVSIDNIKKVYLLGNIEETENYEEVENNEIYNNKELIYINNTEEFSEKVLGETKDTQIKEENVKNNSDEENKYPKAPIIEDIYVINGGETSRYYVYKEPKWNSKAIGYLYGGLTEVKVLDKIGDFSYVEVSNYGTTKKIKGYIPSSRIKKVSPSAIQSVIVDISDQRVYVYENDILIREIICSTGKTGTDTPTGRFLIGGRGSSFSGPGYTCYNYVRFNNNYLFHSVLYHRGTTSVIKYAEAQLGKKASHGCIRLPGEDAKWFYNNIKSGTLVTIQD